MATDDIPRWKWSKRDLLFQELDAQGKIRDIRVLDRLKDAIEPKWYEAPLKMLVVVAAIAFAATFLLFLDKGLELFASLQQGGEDPETLHQGRVIFWFIAGSFTVLVAGGMLIIELLVVRIYALRRLMEIQMRALEQVHREANPEDE